MLYTEAHAFQMLKIAENTKFFYKEARICPKIDNKS